MLNYDRQKFGKAVRAKRGTISPKDFVHRVHVSTAVLSRVERGKVVDDDVILGICKRLELDVGDFPAGRAGDANPKPDADTIE